MKIILILSAILFIGCSEKRDAIEENCIKTNLWVLSSGKSKTRQVYDCKDIDIHELIEKEN